jgi:FkbM family methyltransferase
MTEPFGALAPVWIDRLVMAATSRLPDNWLGLRLAILLRRIVTARLRGDGGLDVVRWGLRMRLHPRRNGCEKGVLFTPQMYEAGEREELFAAVDAARAAGRCFEFVDIGANVGLFSLLVASYAGANARILAIEPEPENLSRLRFNISLNPAIAVDVAALALGEKAETVVLDIDRRDKGGTRTLPLAQGDASGLRVECRPLLAVLREAGVSRIDALKIDVEGNEDTVLAPFFRDAPQSLWPDLIIVEDARQLWRDDLFSLLANNGYEVARRTRLNAILRRTEKAP